jgi:hypothetical protein
MMEAANSTVMAIAPSGGGHEIVISPPRNAAGGTPNLTNF